MKLIGLAVVVVAYVGALAAAVTIVLDWWGDRERRRMGLGCWLYRIGIIKKP